MPAWKRDGNLEKEVQTMKRIRYICPIFRNCEFCLHAQDPTPDKVQEGFEQASEHFREYLSKSLSECVIS